MDHLTKAEAGQLRSQLIEEKSELERLISNSDNFGLEESLGEALAELSTYDNHPADIGTEVYERGKDIALNEQAESGLEDVNVALSRMESGEYGICTQCRKPIPFERLQAVPATLYCLDHVPERNVSDSRPVEEQFLAPPFGRTSLDELDSQNQFDGEDAWQIVESWGTSNTPAMAEDRDVYNYNEMEIENDENDGYVELYESFLATDIYGKNTMVVRNSGYREYMEANEGEGLLEPDRQEDIGTDLNDY